MKRWPLGAAFVSRIARVLRCAGSVTRWMLRTTLVLPAAAHQPRTCRWNGTKEAFWKRFGVLFVMFNRQSPVGAHIAFPFGRTFY